MSLAQAILEYIHDKIKAKTMFSTHYHELTVLEKDLKHLKNVHVSAIEENGKVTFLHKVKELDENTLIVKGNGFHGLQEPQSIIDAICINQHFNKWVDCANCYNGSCTTCGGDGIITLP